MIKKQKSWFKIKRIGKREALLPQAHPKALRRLKRQLHLKGRVGITVTAKMRSVGGNRTVRRRIVMRTYKKGERASPRRCADRRRRCARRRSGEPPDMARTQSATKARGQRSAA